MSEIPSDPRPPAAVRSGVPFDILSTEPSYATFLERYLLPHRPCLLPRSLTAGWAAHSLWSLSGSEEHGTDFGVTWSTPRIDYARISQDYGHHVAPIVTSSEGGETRRDGTVGEAIKAILTDHQQVYIKDWHLFRLDPAAAELVQIPGIFQDDWMVDGVGTPPDGKGRDDFWFCYLGTKGTRTGIHTDVYDSYSWSTNVVGVKRWRFWPPDVGGELKRWREEEARERVPDYETMLNLDSSPPRPGEWEGIRTAIQSTITVIQQPGETIFVPSGWYHQVDNLTDCLSINRNWANATNLESMFQAICREARDVERSLEDVRQILAGSKKQEQEWKQEWCSIVEDVARGDAGWAWPEFWRMVYENLSRPKCAKDKRPEEGWIGRVVQGLARRFEEVKATEEAKRWCDEVKRLLEGERERAPT